MRYAFTVLNTKNGKLKLKEIYAMLYPKNIRKQLHMKWFANLMWFCCHSQTIRDEKKP